MSDKGKPVQKVISYAVGLNGAQPKESIAAIEEALASGYEVANVISTPFGAAGQSNVSGYVSVTVILSLIEQRGHLSYRPNPQG